LNHSEHKFDDFEALRTANGRANICQFKTLIFAGTLDELKMIVELAPTYVAYEPSELVGSTTTSVARAQPEIIFSSLRNCQIGRGASN